VPNIEKKTATEGQFNAVVLNEPHSRRSMTLNSDALWVVIWR